MIMNFTERQNGKKMVTLKQPFHMTTRDMAVVLVERAEQGSDDLTELEFELEFPDRKSVEIALSHYVFSHGHPLNFNWESIPDISSEGPSINAAISYLERLYNL